MITVVIPALNEEENIRGAVDTVVRAAKAANDAAFEIIVVNDGSTDSTGKVADDLARENSCVRVIHREKNAGLGSSFLDGIKAARFDKITLLPGDNAVPLYTIENLFRSASKAEFVIAYIVNTEYRSRFRQLVSKVFSSIYVVAFNLNIKYINGPPVYSVAMLKALNLKARRYSLHSEINVKLLRKGVSFIEIDGYMSPRNNKSSAIRLKNFVEVLICFFRLFIEVHVTRRAEYQGVSKRVLPPNV